EAFADAMTCAPCSLSLGCGAGGGSAVLPLYLLFRSRRGSHHRVCGRRGRSAPPARHESARISPAPTTKTSPHGVRMTSNRRIFPAAAPVLAVCLAVSAAASAEPKTVPFSMGVPVAPIGLADQPLGTGPFTYHTAEQQDIRVTVFTRGLEYPYSIAFLPSG